MAGPFELYEVLEGEYVELYGPLPANYPDANLPPDYTPPRDSRDARLTAICNLIHKRARDGHKRTALCFSGGGIRSATFGLGVLQGLARRGLLKEFDYLSTVSGGGYLGGWFSAWLKRERDTEGSAQAALQKIEAELNTPPAPKLQPEPRRPPAFRPEREPPAEEVQGRVVVPHSLPAAAPTAREHDYNLLGLAARPFRPTQARAARTRNAQRRRLRALRRAPLRRGPPPRPVVLRSHRYAPPTLRRPRPRRNRRAGHLP